MSSRDCGIRHANNNPLKRSESFKSAMVDHGPGKEGFLMLELKLVNGRTFVPEAGFLDLEIGVSGDKIALLGTPGQLPEAKKTIDAKGKTIIPGVIARCYPR